MKIITPGAKEMKGKKCDQDRDFSRVLTAYD